MSKETIEVCRETIINHEKVKSARQNLPAKSEIDNLSDTFKILGDPTRLKIVIALAWEELCVCDIATVVNLSVSAVSHQLRLLRNMRLVKFRKEGKMVYYSLDDEHIENIIQLAQIHVREFSR
ncbi:MAG: transcriptional regulator [Calditrichaeota bacterium]|nr:helix-turn-helix transcriptional regulator [Calditrichota bacterium]RQW04666.1 MAG: transcriptional regulator [Calditrichota bacterium]